MRIELQDESGRAIPAYSLTEAAELVGDDVERVVSWKSGSDLRKLAGQPVKLRFLMKDADIYSLRFRD